MTGLHRSEPLFEVLLRNPRVAGAPNVFDGTIICPGCGDSRPLRLGNRMFNALECRSCRIETRQFTNLCAQTLDPVTGRVGHATLRRELGTRIVRTGLLGLGKISHIRLPHRARAVHLPGQSFILEVTLIDYSSGWEVSRVQRRLSSPAGRVTHLWKDLSVEIAARPHPFFSEDGFRYATSMLRCRSRLLTGERQVLDGYDRLVDLRPAGDADAYEDEPAAVPPAPYRARFHSVHDPMTSEGESHPIVVPRLA